MVDLETLSSANDAAIVAIGACGFTLEQQWLGNLETVAHWPIEFLFYRTIRMSSAMQHGSVSGDTLEWWFQQSDRARMELLREPVSIERALKDFSDWWPKDAKMWSHATFDAPILSNAYEKVFHRRQPWHHRDARDLRTLAELAGGHRDEDYPSLGGLKHVAYADAIAQACAAQRMYLRIMLGQTR
jgi:hypothetical protein